MKYDIVRLGELCELVNGYAFKSKDFVEKGFPVIKIKNVKPNRILLDNLSYVDGKIVIGKEQYIINKGDILLTMTGNRYEGSPDTWVGKSAVFMEKGVYYLNQRLCKILPKTDKINKNYLAYFLSSWDSQLYFIKGATSSGGQANISPMIIKELEIPVPNMGIQNKIAGLLYALDEKIRINNRINDNLAALLQTLYQEQFGDVVSESTQGHLSDLCSYSRDRVSVSRLNANTYFSTENMLPGKAGATEAASLPTTPQTTACHKGDTLISNIRPYFKKIVYCEDECGCSTDVLCFTPIQSRYVAYLFSTLYADKFFAFMVAGSKGTKMPRGDKQQIMSYPIVLPSDEELDEFNDLALPILTQIHSNRGENKRLSAVRDALLPKLMSGKIDVSAIQL